MNTQHQLNNTGGLLLNINENARKVIFAICIVLCLMPFMSPAVRNSPRSTPGHTFTLIFVKAGFDRFRLTT